MPISGVRKSKERLSWGDRDRVLVSAARVCSRDPSDPPLWVHAAGACMKPTVRTGAAAHPSWTRFSAATRPWPGCCSNSTRYRNGPSRGSQIREHRQCGVTVNGGRGGGRRPCLGPLRGSRVWCAGSNWRRRRALLVRRSDCRLPAKGAVARAWHPPRLAREAVGLRWKVPTPHTWPPLPGPPGLLGHAGCPGDAGHPQGSRHRAERSPPLPGVRAGRRCGCQGRTQPPDAAAFRR